MYQQLNLFGGCLRSKMTLKWKGTLKVCWVVWYVKCKRKMRWWRGVGEVIFPFLISWTKFVLIGAFKFIRHHTVIWGHFWNLCSVVDCHRNGCQLWFGVTFQPNQNYFIWWREAFCSTIFKCQGKMNLGDCRSFSILALVCVYSFVEGYLTSSSHSTQVKIT